MCCVCVGWGGGIGNVEEVVKMTGVTGQHTPTGTGTANTEAKARIATCRHSNSRPYASETSELQIHSLTHSLTHGPVWLSCLRVQCVYSSVPSTLSSEAKQGTYNSEQQQKG